MENLASVVNTTAKIDIPSLSEVIRQYPCSQNMAQHIAQSRHTISKIFNGQDDRLMVVIGPCSIHDTEASLEYAHKLLALGANYQQQLHVVMRTYFEKPRTTVGWKGLIFDPYLDGSDDLITGLFTARKLLVDINDLGLSTATEFLDVTSFFYLSDLMSWGAIGARTTESQVHRQMASGLNCPIGFKNGTDGNITIAADAMTSAAHPHLYPMPDFHGGMCAVKSKGNATCHAIMRGGKQPNYYHQDITAVEALLKSRDLCTKLMIDCSHGNSRKLHLNQLRVVEDLCRQLAHGSSAIAAVMVESFLKGGNQALNTNNSLRATPLNYGQSITDACIGWSDTERLIEMLAEGVESRRQIRNLEQFLV